MTTSDGLVETVALERHGGEVEAGAQRDRRQVVLLGERERLPEHRGRLLEPVAV